MGKYSDSPVWADVAPLLQEESVDTPLAQIAYSDEYTEAMSYLRAIMAAGDHSDRVMGLTEDIIRMNPAHYTVWLYRAETIFALKYPIQKEIEFVNILALKFLKNYQIWHHRQLLIDQLGDCTGEAAFLDSMLAKDAKNYHVWSYRQWMVKRFNLWNDEGEMQCVEDLLDEDLRNNSAWNHRWFLVFGRPGSDALSKEELLKREIDYTETKIQIAPQNESPWNYLRAMYSKATSSATSPKDGIVTFAAQFSGLEDGTTKSSHALDFLATVYADDPQRKASALKALDLLADKYDPIRAPYWRYRKAMVNAGVSS